MSAKETALELIRALPDDATENDILNRLEARFGPTGEEDGEDVPQDEWEAAWAEEVNRRIEDMESGRVQGIPADEFFRKLREKYG